MAGSDLFISQTSGQVVLRVSRVELLNLGDQNNKTNHPCDITVQNIYKHGVGYLGCRVNRLRELN